MSNTPVQPGDLQSLWQSMPTTPVVITAQEMRARAEKFERKVRRRNYVEYIAAIFVIAGFGWYATWPEPATPLWPISNIAIVIGTLVVMWNLHRVGRAMSMPGETELATLIDFHRSGLIRQRDALRSVWRWYLLPFLPGLVLWFVAIWVGRGPDAEPVPLAIALAFAILLSVAVSAGIILLNLLGAARLQRMIDDLDRYGDQ